jgi:hypothetical protein
VVQMEVLRGVADDALTALDVHDPEQLWVTDAPSGSRVRGARRHRQSIESPADGTGTRCGTPRSRPVS